MAEQTLEIRAVSGLTNVTMFVKNIDTVEDIATGAVAGAVVANSTVYRHTFTDLVAATRLVGLRDANNNVIVDTLITIGAATGVYRATSNADIKADIAGIDASLSAGDIDAIVAGVTTVSSSIQQAQAGILTAYEYTTWDQDFDDLLILTNYTDIIFVLKRRLQDLDSEALLKVSSSTGLIILNGVDVSATRSAEASISITQQTPTGELSLSVESSAMAEVPRGKWIDGLKMLNPNGDKILRQGTTIVRESAVDETS
jgi:hypothetical protein